MLSPYALLWLLPFSFTSYFPFEFLGDGLTCRIIQASISSASEVFYPGSPSYATGTDRWVSSARQDAACVVEPASAQDVSIILKILGKTHSPFGIKGGGHFADQGVSSSPGVQIVLKRLNNTIYNEHFQTAELGAGQVWDDVYAKLEPHSVMVLGGRLSGVGVSGFLLGGGYSWLTNKHGLAIDSVLEYELVLANGKIVTVNKYSYPDLFFGLKGGYNNFGIVTKFTVPTYPQGQVWGGMILYGEDALESLRDALVDFQESSADPEAMTLTGFIGSGGMASAATIVFYNAPEPKSGVFDKFLSIPSVSQDVGPRSFLSLVKSVSGPFLNTIRLRGAQSTIRISGITEGMVDEVINQAHLLSSYAPSSIASWVVEPLLRSAVVREDKSVTAWPHDHFLNPMSLYFFWDGEDSDPVAHESMHVSGRAIEAACVADKQDLDSVMLYPNYAAANSTLESVYGSNLPRLQALASKYDPEGVMKRTGGFKF